MGLSKDTVTYYDRCMIQVFIDKICSDYPKIISYLKDMGSLMPIRSSMIERGQGIIEHYGQKEEEVVTDSNVAIVVDQYVLTNSPNLHEL